MCLSVIGGEDAASQQFSSLQEQETVDRPTFNESEHGTSEHLSELPDEQTQQLAESGVGFHGKFTFEFEVRG